MNTPHDEVFDLGLQNERTALAWRRTALSLATAAVVIGRLTMGRLGIPAVILAGACAVAATAVGHLSMQRYRRAHRSLTATQPPALVTDGFLPLLLCGMTLVLSGLMLAYTFT